jgi:hypothetical protein
MIIKVAGATVAVDASTYAAGDLVGAKLTLSNAYPVESKEPFLHSITVQDLDKQNAELDFVFFDSDPSGTTFTDDAALDIADADLPKVIGFATLTASDYCDFADSSVGTVGNLGIACKPAINTLYCAIVARGTPTYSANGLSVVFGFVA